jgi:hypothetical protein
VVVNTQPGDRKDSIEIEGVYTDFRDAVANLKLARLGAEDGWIVPMDRETRDNYPYRNKIGQIWADKQYLGWGYAWFDSRGGDSVNRVWIARARLWCRNDNSASVTYDSDWERDLVDDTSDIEGVSNGQELPGDARFDSRTGDVIFPGEEGYDEEGDHEESDSEDDDAHVFTKFTG